MACWIILGIASAVFYKKASYDTKKAWHPIIVIAMGAIFLGFTEWVMHASVPWFFVIALIFICFLNIRNTQFCPKCGATIFGRGLSRPQFCYKCGADLQP